MYFLQKVRFFNVFKNILNVGWFFMILICFFLNTLQFKTYWVEKETNFKTNSERKKCVVWPILRLTELYGHTLLYSMIHFHQFVFLRHSDSQTSGAELCQAQFSSAENQFWSRESGMTDTIAIGPLSEFWI